MHALFMSRNIFLISWISILLSTSSCANEAKVSPVPFDPTQTIQLAHGFQLQVYAKLHDLIQDMRYIEPRMMAFDASGNLYVSFPNKNMVLMLTDEDKNGVADKSTLVSNQLNAPHGLTFIGDKLYVANQDGVVVLEKNNEHWPSKPPINIINNLPTGGHTLKSLKLGPDGLLYIQVGSSCNVCQEHDALRATILRYTPEGKPAGALTTLGRHAPNPIYASGLRNSQGFTWHPISRKMFATNEGADNRSEIKNGITNDELPPEHLNQIEAGKNYGWPYCWADSSKLRIMFSDPNFVRDTDYCRTTTAPAITFTSHSTPIGISFLHNANVPSEYKQDAIVALHGSWNRQKPSGYKLVRVKFNDDNPIAVEDFATGWLNNETSWGRPVDVIVGPDGAVYVSDDRAGLIYRIHRKN